MKFALINPNWNYAGSIFFGCPEPHLPLEFGYAAALLTRAGHQALIVDAHLFNLSVTEIEKRIVGFQPDFIVIETAPTYLFWRCPPPELRIPRDLICHLRGSGGQLIAVGPHGSATPAATLEKLEVDAVVRGEFEDLLPRFAEPDWRQIPGIAYRGHGGLRRQGAPWMAAVDDLPPIEWPALWLERHGHHHHRFDSAPPVPGAEIEASRGCPYHCVFCAKENFRGLYRKRQASSVLQELDRLLRQGVGYVYFIDEIFLPDPSLLAALTDRPVQFGIQTRIDLWSPEMLKRLGRAGCVSIEAGVESLSAAGRQEIGKPSRFSTDEITERLALAKRHVPFVQANLLATDHDDCQEVADWRQRLLSRGVWSNDPVPLFPYPGSPAYRQRWGDPDDLAWERAHAWYLDRHATFSDLQDRQPRSLAALESSGGLHG